MKNLIKLFEVGPRDGLQNEKKIIPTLQKIKLINLLSTIGFEQIETTSFVSQKKVPQLADATEVMKKIKRKNNTRYTVLIPNIFGFENAIKVGVNEIAVFTSATEEFSLKNINCTINESFKRFLPVIKLANENNILVRGYISCVIDCPYKGNVSPLAVLNVAEKLLEMGCYEISLGDTIGQGNPKKLSKLLNIITKKINPNLLVGHFHDTNNRAIENVFKSIEFGISKFDTSIGGLGGCPFAPGAKGNVSTRHLNNALNDAGWVTNLNNDNIIKTEKFLKEIGLKSRV